MNNITNIKLLISFCLLLIINVDSVEAQNVNIPDNSFKNALVSNAAINTNSDNEIQVSEANAFTGYLMLAANNIYDLTGLEAFVNLTGLNVSSNLFNTLDVTSNVALVDLRCAYNDLTTLDISNCPSLKKLWIWNNQISSLNLANNPLLDSVDFSYNNITNVDLSANTELLSLNCGFNQITSLDLSSNILLEELYCYNNNLTSLNIQNGNNSNLIYFAANNNPNGLCVKVDDVATMSTNWPNGIDVGSYYSVTCGPCTINVPDVNFKAALLANPYINTNSNQEIECTEAASYTGSIFVLNSNISDLTGIEEFTGISQLNCSMNNLTSLDLSANAALYFVDANFNQLTNLILPSGSTLSEVIVSNNQLTNVEVSSNSYLTYLDCNNNNLTNLNILSNSYVSYIFCNNNQITDLDCSNNGSLIQLDCASNQLISLNIQNGNNINLTSFDASNNPQLTCVQVDSVASMNLNWPNAIDVSVSYNLSCAGACTVTIPDVNFKNELLSNLAINTNADNEIQCAEAAAFTGYLNVQLSNITDLTGIEAFTAIDSLNCASNQLTSLDLSSNTALIFIQCFGNQLTNINVTGLTNLKVLYCYLNNITNLDVSTNTALIVLNCNANQLTNLNTNSNTALLSLGCGSNLLTNINVSNNPLLTTFGCGNNFITSLNLQFNPLISTLGFNQNQITYMDLSNLTQLDDLSANDNNLSYLNIQNGNNMNLQDFDATGNPNLTCIQVDDVTFMNNNFASYIDATASFSLNCSVCTVNIPDSNFKNALVANFTVNTNGNAEIECSEAAVFSDTLYVGNLGIADLTGIEAFTALKGLVCNLNNLTTLDLSSNVALQFLHAYDNQLSSLNVTNNTALVNLWISNNNLDSLDVTQNLLLEGLACFYNNFSNIDVSNNLALKDFRCAYNPLFTVDVSNNTQLELWYAGNCLINTLDLSNNPLLQQLDCGPNQLTTLDLSNNTALSTLEAGQNDLVALDLSNNPALTTIFVNGNALTSLKIDNGNNDNLNNFSAVNNPNLICIQVDDESYMNTNWSNAKDAGASYSNNCLGACPGIPLAFNANNTNITIAPMSVTFSNTTPNLANYEFVWYFGDGTMLQSNDASINHTYYFNGIYSVSLVAQDLSNGCYDTLYTSNYITCNSGSALSCNHTVSLNPSGVVNACVGSVVPLNSTSSLANATYQWNRNGVIIGGASQDNYFADANGNYTLTVFNAQGCPVTSSPTQINYSLQSSVAPTITATGPANSCGDVNVTLTANGSFANYLWSNGQTGNSITVNQGGSYTVIGQSPACDVISLPYNVLGSNAPVPPICMITVDESDNKNVVIWEKPISNEIDSFLVLREDVDNPSVYTILSAQSYVDLSEFKDISSDANARAYRYKLAVMDTCGGVTIPSSAQRSIHLDVAQGNSILSRQLTWNVYQGQPQAFDYYLIYRETAPGNLNLALIDSVPSTQTWYYDNSLTQIADTARAYKIGYRVLSPCVSSRAQSDVCSSNVTANEKPVIEGINAIEFKDSSWSVFPNPNTGMFIIQLQTAKNYQLKVFNLIGEELNQLNLTGHQTEIDLSGLSEGVYILNLSDGISSLTKRLVVTK